MESILEVRVLLEGMIQKQLIVEGNEGLYTSSRRLWNMDKASFHSIYLCGYILIANRNKGLGGDSCLRLDRAVDAG